MIFSSLIVPFDTNFNLLRKKNHFSIYYHFMILISWFVIIDVISITDVLIIFLPSNQKIHQWNICITSATPRYTHYCRFLFWWKHLVMFGLKLPNIYFIMSIWIPSFLIILSNDVHVHPGPNNNNKKTFSFCNWDCNSITKDDFNRVDLLEM